MKQLLLLAAVLIPSFPLAAAELPEAVVFKAGVGGYHTYRIPALLVSPKGSLLAFCEGRKTGRGDHGDIDLMLKRSSDGGKTWSEQQLVLEEGDTQKVTIGNPCPVVDQETGVIWLPLTRDNDDVLMLSSADDGVTWSKPVDITKSVKRDEWSWYATGPGNGIQLQHGKFRGRLVIPCDHKVKNEKDKNLGFRSHVIYSDDHGKTWQLGGVLDPTTNECAVAELDDGTLLINMRTYRGKSQRTTSRSTDGGLTWSPIVDEPTLVEPVCQGSLIRIPATKSEPSLLAFSNPANPKQRQNLTIRLSRDGGKTWPASRVLCAGSSIYSSLAALPDGDIGVLFERDNYKELVFTRLSPAQIESSK
ncbi:Sialidase precursor [Anatilimnocola aggregata]|uniref:exo-alpha-sialidase n=1 Tax=Anatilimnocola aggregata TaxID=2528021 RepID=A0A517Y7W0_9BACT|nr:sialidase family protein [Anatilimnocola aggregata]QDU26291.1 Sialidase precursor [Anatilimnocola aggregata]